MSEPHCLMSKIESVPEPVRTVPTPSVTSLNFRQRLTGVFLLRDSVFHEIGDGQGAARQAALIVFLVGLISAVNALVMTSLLKLGSGVLNQAINFIEGLLSATFFRLPSFDVTQAVASRLLGAFVAWFVWAAVAAVAGSILTRRRAGFGRMARITGFAQAPRLLALIGVIPIPFLGLIMSALAWLWALLALHAGVRDGLQIDGERSVGIMVLCVLATLAAQHWLVQPFVAAVF